jgi:hypothetical protein
MQEKWFERLEILLRRSLWKVNDTIFNNCYIRFLRVLSVIDWEYDKKRGSTVIENGIHDKIEIWFWDKKEKELKEKRKGKEKSMQGKWKKKGK